MRRFLLLGFVTVGLLLGTFGMVKASTRSTVEIDEGTREYWRSAQKLTQDQLVLLSRVEQAMPKTNVKRLQTLRGQALLHTSAIDRFLTANHPDPKTICAPAAELGAIAGTDAASPEQLQVFCALFDSTQDLRVLRSRLDRQAKLLSSQVGSGGTPTRTAQRRKTAIVNVPVGIAASAKEILLLVQSSRQRLAQVQPIFSQTVSSTPQRSIGLSRKPENSDSWK